jgi:acetyl-CoA acyltransferase
MAAGQGGRTGRRVAIVAGLRTPFVKSSGAYRTLSALELGKAVVTELLERAELPPAEVQLLVFGQVLPSIQAPNIAREVVLGSALPRTLDAFSVARACATSLQAMTNAADQIALGGVDVAIAGGAESLSDVPVTISKPLTRALMGARKEKTLVGKLRAFRRLSPGDLVPVAPAIAEYTTGLTMGESAEIMAKENRIARSDQDLVAHRSHENAAKAWASGVFADEVMRLPVPPKYEATVVEDDLVRKDSALAAYARLPPVFDRRYGSVTAGNASPLTDGAAALLLMSEERARELGRTPLGYLRSYAYAAVDPAWQLLQGPAFAVPRALDQAGLRLADMDLVEMHEAFAAQVLSNIQALESDAFARERLGRDSAVGEVRRDRLNVNGGSIALGHPFGATGARLVTQALRELARRDGQFALVSACAAGGLGAAAVLERV